MIDFWTKLVSYQFEVALNLTRAAFEMCGREAPLRKIKTRADSAQTGTEIIPGIISFLKAADGGATARQIAEYLKMDKKSLLPLLKGLVKERRIDELLGRYCVR